MSTITASALADATTIPAGTRLLAEAAAKIQSASELVSLSAGESSDPSRGKLLQSFAERLEAQYRLLRRIVFASRGGHRL